MKFIFSRRSGRIITDENPQVFRYPAIETNIKIKFPFGDSVFAKNQWNYKNLDLDIIHSQHPNLLGSAAAALGAAKKYSAGFHLAYAL